MVWFFSQFHFLLASFFYEERQWFYGTLNAVNWLLGYNVWIRKWMWAFGLIWMLINNTDGLLTIMPDKGDIGDKQTTPDCQNGTALEFPRYIPKDLSMTQQTFPVLLEKWTWYYLVMAYLMVLSLTTQLEGALLQLQVSYGLKLFSANQISREKSGNRGSKKLHEHQKHVTCSWGRQTWGGALCTTNWVLLWKRLLSR